MSAREPLEKLTPKQLAYELQVALTTLVRWRLRRRGPPYHRQVTRIFYYRDDVDKWKESTKWG